MWFQKLLKTYQRCTSVQWPTCFFITMNTVVICSSFSLSTPSSLFCCFKCSVMLQMGAQPPPKNSPVHTVHAQVFGNVIHSKLFWKMKEYIHHLIKKIYEYYIRYSRWNQWESCWLRYFVGFVNSLNLQGFLRMHLLTVLIH